MGGIKPEVVITGFVLSKVEIVNYCTSLGSVYSTGIELRFTM